jgi:hypothetical protein
MNSHGLSPHIARATRRGRPQSAERKAVEAVMRTATPSTPLTPGQIASRAGVADRTARAHICAILHRGLAYNTAAGKRRAASYAWGSDPAIATLPRVQPTVRAGSYDGRELRPYEGRPGAMDAFTLPSLQNGKRVPRKAPVIVAATHGRRMAARGGDALEAGAVRKDRR